MSLVSITHNANRYKRFKIHWFPLLTVHAWANDVVTPYRCAIPQMKIIIIWFKEISLIFKNSWRWMTKYLPVATSARPDPPESFEGISTPTPPNFPVSNLSNFVHLHRYYCNAYNEKSFTRITYLGCGKPKTLLPADLPERMYYNIIYFVHVSLVYLQNDVYVEWMHRSHQYYH